MYQNETGQFEIFPIRFMIRVGRLYLMGKYIIVISAIFLSNPCFAQTEETNTGGPSMMISGNDLKDFMNYQNGGGRGCFESLLENTSQGMAATLEAQSNSANTVSQIIGQAFEHEQSCGNQLAEPLMQINMAKTEHQNVAAKLPLLINNLQEEYFQAVETVKAECRNSSGEIFMKWKAAQSQGVVRAEDGGVQALEGRTNRINGYQKLFYDDCIAREDSIARVQSLSRQLSNNIEMARIDVQNSARNLAALSKNLELKQGIIAKNCKNGKNVLDAQAALARNVADASRTMAKRNNYLRMLSGVGVCLTGPGGLTNYLQPADSTAAQATGV